MLLSSLSGDAQRGVRPGAAWPKNRWPTGGSSPRFSECCLWLEAAPLIDLARQAAPHPACRDFERGQRQPCAGRREGQGPDWSGLAPLKEMVRVVGIEPTLLSEPDFESGASTNSTTPAFAAGRTARSAWSLRASPPQRKHLRTPPRASPRSAPADGRKSPQTTRRPCSLAHPTPKVFSLLHKPLSRAPSPRWGEGRGEGKSGHLRW